MPTISNALLRHPSFPLIVPKAEWRTPQIIKNSSGITNYNAQNMPNVPLSHQNQEFQPSKSRPRAVSLQIPFMGGTIVPSNHMNLAKKFRIRRNSVPPSNVADERYGSNHLLLLSWQISFKTLTEFFHLVVVYGSIFVKELFVTLPIWFIIQIT